MSSPDPAVVLANWTAAATTDATALFTDVLPYLKTLGSVYADYQLLDPADQGPLKAVDPAKLVVLLNAFRDTQQMVEKCLNLIR